LEESGEDAFHDERCCLNPLEMVLSQG